MANRKTKIPEYPLAGSNLDGGRPTTPQFDGLEAAMEVIAQGDDTYRSQADLAQVLCALQKRVSLIRTDCDLILHAIDTAQENISGRQVRYVRVLRPDAVARTKRLDRAIGVAS